MSFPNPTADPDQVARLMNPTDAVSSLLAQARAGDGSAFCELCRPLEGRLRKQARLLARDDQTADELAQDTLVEAWKALERFDGRCQFFTWLCAIMLRRHGRLLRRQRSWFALLRSAETTVTTSPAAEGEADPHQAAQEAERVASIREALEALPSAHREVVYLRFYCGDDLQSIASALQISLGTVKSRLFHALEKLRKMKAIQTWSD